METANMSMRIAALLLSLLCVVGTADASRAITGGQFLAVDTTIVTDEPLTMMCWFKRTGVSNTQTFIMLGEKDQASGGNSWQLGINSSDAIFGRTESGGSGAGTGTSTTNIGNDTTNWHFAAFRTSGNASRYAQVDTTLTAEQTSSITVTSANVNTLRIGINTGSGGVEFADALLAHCAVWNVALSDTDLTNLAGGDNPTAIQCSNLKAYFPFTTSSIADSSSSGLTLTDSGTSFNADNPTVDDPVACSGGIVCNPISGRCGAAAPPIVQQ